ncbi:ARM repeat-containing protein [Vararia minispora EC-137]|uniref:ARM repeat-containing protein n=1 Tax=Vararia minispora EC-137 TaxID=1314806 RepID=A0ACB8QGD4_9AGAM|nr:ARM repeat-containing protein [Vararia minispora EC-137]
MNHNALVPVTSDVPIPIEDLFSIVCAAASQDPNVMLTAATRLRDCLKLPGTVNSLHHIASQKSAPLSVRQLAIIQCKNEIPTQWRQRKTISPQDKAEIRQRCALYLDEEDVVISQCNEIIVSKVARSDFPNQWPTLIDELVSRIQQGFAERDRFPGVQHESSCRVLKRSLRVLKAIIKEFASIKMPLGVQTMGQIMGIIHGPLSVQYERSSSDLRSKVQQGVVDSPRMIEDIHLCHLLLKCVTIMATWVWQSSITARREVSHSFEDWVIAVFQASVNDLQDVYEARQALATPPTAQQLGVVRMALECLTQYVRTIGKFFRRLQQLSGSRFVNVPLGDKLVFYLWNKVVQSTRGSNLIADSPTAVFPVRLLVQAMVIFRDALAQWSPKKIVNGPAAIVIDRDFVQTAITFLVTQFMPLKANDLQNWMADPEAFVNIEDQEDVQWEFSIRPCAERVLMTFSSQYPEITNPLLVTAFNNVNSKPATTLDAVLEKEAVYGAVGRCSHRLKEMMDLSAWLNLAAQESRNPERDYLIIKRRIAWLLGRWMMEQTVPPRETRVWDILVHLLSDNSIAGSEVVRLTAATAIQHSVDAIAVTSDNFAPYIPAILNQLVGLMEEVDSNESKRKVNDCLNAVIARAGDKIVPFANLVTGPLAKIWAESGKEFIFKSSIMNTLGTLITSLGEHSAPLVVLVVQVVSESLSPEFSVELDEHGLKLWQTALRYTTTLQSQDGAPGLGSLAPLIIQMLDSNYDLLGRITNILESYFLLGASDLLHAYAVPVFSAYVVALGNAVAANVRDLLNSLELLFQLADPSTYAQALHSSGLFAWLVKGLIEDKLDTLTLTVVVYVHARIVIASRENYVNLMAATAQNTMTPEAELWAGVLDQWWRRFDNISDPRYRKLCALGAASLVSTGRPEVLDRLPTEIFTMWSDVFAELIEVQRRREEDGEAVVSFYWDQPADSFFKGTEDTIEYSRRKAVFDNDIVRSTLMSTFVAQRLQEAEAVCGSQNLKEILSKADENLFKSIRKEIFGTT